MVRKMPKISLHDQRRQAERRLVEQHQLRAQHQRARNRQHLLLAARQRARLLLPAFLQAREITVDALEIGFDLGLVFAGVGAQPQVFLGGQIAKVPRPSGTCATPRRTMSSVDMPSMRLPSKRISPVVLTII